MELITPRLMYWCFPPCGLSDEALAYALDLANGDIEDERVIGVDALLGREIIDVEYEEISSTNERPLALPDNQ